MSRYRLKQPPTAVGEHLHPSSTEPRGSTNLDHPIFCLRHLANLDECERFEQIAFVKTLRDLARQTWQELLVRHKHKGGCESIPVSQLSGVRLPKLAVDRGSVTVFRFQAKKAMIGVREGALFRVIHLDRDFTAYDH